MLGQRGMGMQTQKDSKNCNSKAYFYYFSQMHTKPATRKRTSTEKNTSGKSDLNASEKNM